MIEWPWEHEEAVLRLAMDWGKRLESSSKTVQNFLAMDLESLL